MNANNLSKIFLKWWQEQNPEGRIYRNNAGAVHLKKRFIRYGIPPQGGADFIAFVPEILEGYKYLIVQFYEIKTKNDRMSKEQIKFANMIVNMGGEYFIVHENIFIHRNDCAIGNHPNSEQKFYIEKWIVK